MKEAGMLDNFPAPWQKKLSSMAGNSGNVPAPEPAEKSVVKVNVNDSTLDLTGEELMYNLTNGVLNVIVDEYDDNETTVTHILLLTHIAHEAVYEFHFLDFVSFGQVVYESYTLDDYPVES